MHNGDVNMVHILEDDYTTNLKNDTPLYIVKDVLRNGIMKTYGHRQGNHFVVYNFFGEICNFYNQRECKTSYVEAKDFAEVKRKEKIQRLEEQIQKLKALEF